jgi:hypothetical protein
VDVQMRVAAGRGTQLSLSESKTLWTRDGQLILASLEKFGQSGVRRANLLARGCSRFDSCARNMRVEILGFQDFFAV